MSCMLLLTVPQKCDYHVCSTFEHIGSSNPVIITGFTVNLATLCMFLLMYLVEIQREHKMINYLEVDIKLPRDNESVGQELNKLPKEKHDTWSQYIKNSKNTRRKVYKVIRIWKDK